MTRAVEIISKGRCVKVSELELEELRVAGVNWYSYSQSRLTRSHADAVSKLTAKK